MEQGRFLIVTGMSGAGKTQVLRTLEDLNYFCVDNLPIVLLPKFAELCRQTPNRDAAMVVDVRGGSADQFVDILEEMKANGFPYEVVYMDAGDATLIRRYKETRRRHPLEQGHNSLAASVALERRSLMPVRELANQVFDTSTMSVADLKTKIRSMYGGEEAAGHLLIVVQSFGFKHGLPMEADLVFDVRFMPNPFYIQELRSLTGLDKPVADYVFSFQQTQDFLAKLKDLLSFALPLYAEEGKTQLVIAVGCTGGHHRSVAVTHALTEFIRSQGYQVTENHRDMTRGS
ncbi:MAG TPA: RNase adapter RapZ [Acidaminococcaceae bacterium]|nr:RNase adapter RapZ [Acidaminococcaceae bacterium]